MSVNEFDVVIVGCGPVGALLANQLKDYGHDVAVFEMYEEVFYSPRAMGFDDESPRLLQSMGLLERLKKEGNISNNELYFVNKQGKRVLTFNADQLGMDLLTESCGIYNMTPFHQPNLERTLREEFKTQPNPVTTFYNHQVTALSDDLDVVKLSARELSSEDEVKIRAKYVIGCDGANSFVRKEMQADFINQKYSERFLVIDSIVDDKEYYEDVLGNCAYFTLGRESCGVCMRGLHGHYRFDFVWPDDVAIDDTSEFEQIAHRHIVRMGLDPEKFRHIRFAPYVFEAKTSSLWRKGRLLVAGDAAHVTPPWSGQGLNMGVRDTWNLAFKLDLVLSGKASDDLLDSYFLERQPASMRTISGAISTGEMLQASNPLKVLMRDATYYLSSKSRWLRRKLFKSWVRKPPYTDGFFGWTHKLSGHLMPQPTLATMQGEPIKLDDLIGNNFALLSNHSARGVDVSRFVNQFGGKKLGMITEYDDPSGEMLGWFQKHKVDSVLLRPDRYIYDAGKDGNELCRDFLRNIEAGRFKK